MKKILKIITVSILVIWAAFSLFALSLAVSEKNELYNELEESQREREKFEMYYNAYHDESLKVSEEHNQLKAKFEGIKSEAEFNKDREELYYNLAYEFLEII